MWEIWFRVDRKQQTQFFFRLKSESKRLRTLLLILTLTRLSKQSKSTDWLTDWFNDWLKTCTYNSFRVVSPVKASLSISDKLFPASRLQREKQETVSEGDLWPLTSAWPLSDLCLIYDLWPLSAALWNREKNLLSFWRFFISEIVSETFKEHYWRFFWSV